MSDMLRTIEFLGDHIWKNENRFLLTAILSQQDEQEENGLVTGVTARKQSENKCLFQICQILLNYV